MNATAERSSDMRVWSVVVPYDEHDKENVGYIVRRPSRRRGLGALPRAAPSPSPTPTASATRADSSSRGKLKRARTGDSEDEQTASDGENSEPRQTKKKQKTTARDLANDAISPERNEKKQGELKKSVVQVMRPRRQPLRDITHLFPHEIEHPAPVVAVSRASNGDLEVQVPDRRRSQPWTRASPFSRLAPPMRLR
ncbi:hypothetical protein ATCC90586_006818 [Pythium insidiosum]|nr:hypothetical protein ATCC90586_006818 [Pythium insidiosum]